MAVQQLALPIAVVLAGTVVAVAIVMTRPPAPAPAVAATSSVAATPAPPPSPVQPVPTETPEVRARGRENAARALEAYRAEFVRTCWAPAVAERPEPRQIPLVFNLSFSPGGEIVGIGIDEDRAVNRADVAMCLRKIDVKPRIPAPGVALLLDVPFTLP